MLHAARLSELPKRAIAPARDGIADSTKHIVAGPKNARCHSWTASRYAFLQDYMGHRS